MREKLSRLERVNTTQASDLLNDIYQNMNSKVKSIPEVQSRPFDAAPMGEFKSDMNQKMARMQR